MSQNLSGFLVIGQITQGLVDPGGRLHGQAPLLIRSTGEAIGVDGGLEGTEALTEQGPVQSETLGQTKQLEVVTGEVEHRPIRR